MKRYCLLILLIVFVGCGVPDKKTEKVLPKVADYSSFCDAKLPKDWHIVKFGDSTYGAYKEKGYAGLLTLWLMSKGSVAYDTNVSENWATHFKDTCELKANISDIKDYKVIR